MFGDERRKKVDLSGKSAGKRTGGKELLAQKLAERQQRELLRAQEKSSLVIQSAYRGLRERRKAKAQFRAEFSPGLETVLLAVKSGKDADAMDSLLSLIRKFVFFFHESEESDFPKAVQIWKLVVALSKLPDKRSFLHTAFSESAEFRSRWIFVMAKLCGIGASCLNKPAIASSLSPMLLWFIDLDQWPENPTLPSEKLKELHYSVINEVFAQKSKFFEKCRLAFVNHIREKVEGEKGRKTLMTVVVSIIAIVLKSLKVSLSKSSLESEEKSDIKRSANGQVESFIINFLALPLLSSRLLSWGFSQILSSIFSPPLRDICLEILCSDSLSFPPVQRQGLIIPPRDLGSGKVEKTTIPPVVWLFGNLLEIISFNSGSSGWSRKSEYVLVLLNLLEKLPAHVFPKKLNIAPDFRVSNPIIVDSFSSLQSSADSEDEDEVEDVTFQSPSFKASDFKEYKESKEEELLVTAITENSSDLQLQLSILVQPQFLDFLSESLSESFSSTALLSAISSLIDRLLQVWPSARSQVLSSLVFPSGDVKSLRIFPLMWKSLQSTGVLISLLEAVAAPSITFYSKSSASSKVLTLEFAQPYLIFAQCFSFYLKHVDDEEFFSVGLSLLDVPSLVSFLNKLFCQVSWVNFHTFSLSDSAALKLDTSSLDGAVITVNRLTSASSNLFQLLHDRQSRRMFCGSDLWQLSVIDSATFRAEVSRNLPRSMFLYETLPFVIPFSSRVSLLYDLINEDKSAWYESSGSGPFDEGIRVRIRREFIVEDSFIALQAAGPRMKGVIRIEFVNDLGLPEAGIDGGGLFKEFLTRLCGTAFTPSLGLFSETPSHTLYPFGIGTTGASGEAESLQILKFLGLVLGKAIYEGILVEPQFAGFFLRKMIGKKNYFDDLWSLDPELYKGLNSVKNFSGDFKTLSLNFTVTIPRSDGKTDSVELFPGGEKLEVTKENVVRFVQLVADYHLNRRIRRACEAFFSGLSEVLDPRWLRLFSAQELQAIISGSKSVDIEDLQKFATYSGGYSADSPQILWFWELVKTMNEDEKALLLRFVTSCSRAPLMGFGSLQPPFCIQRSGGAVDALPTSSTCVNLLRLPEYPTKELLIEKVMYAVRSNAGFDLS